jgi:hypothetical protein
MSCIEVQQSIATWLPFVAVDETDGAPRTGIIFSQIDASYKKSSQSSFNVKSLTAPEFRENGNGVYEILFSDTDLDTLGTFLYVVNSNGGLPSPAIRQFVGQAVVVSAAAYTPGTITLSTNIITGNLISLQGSPLVGEAVSARVLSSPNVQGTSPNIGGVGTDLVTALTDSGGFFALEVLQGAVIDVVIPSVNYRRTLTVPNNSTDLLFDIP